MKTKKGYESLRLSFNRLAVIASASVTKEKNAIHSFTEIDITEPRRLIGEYFKKTEKKLSFTAYIVACLARVIKDHPQINSFIKGKRLIILDDVTVSVLIEREIVGEKVPEPIGIKQAQIKTYLQIHDEIREAKKKQNDRLGGLSGKTWIRLIPRFLLKTFVRIADKNIRLAKAYGKVAVTAVGMFSKEAVWFVPHGTATVLITVGSMSQKVVEMEGQFVSREHLCLTVSFDHNIVDGAPASRFMNQFVQTIKSGELVRLELEKLIGSS
ncbi:MAG: 2-oxo acid dehydrogenase subunit E2 [Candidatus Aminicenantes bacterium]|nr:2-oxo acid dehydrogenase subunit E2 [Candidatus Aminicenantes bacterium]